MTDTVQEQEKPRTRARKSGPNAEMKSRRKARKSRGVVDHGFDRKLGLDESKLDHKNYRYRWVKDAPGRIASMMSREWEQVEEDDINGQEVKRRMGVDDNNQMRTGVLMRKYKPWYDEDAQERLDFQKSRMQEMMRGKSSEQAEGGEAPGYAVASNKVETGTTTRSKRTNPDFE